MRPDGRAPDQLRPVKITPDFNRYAEGSVLVEFGETKVICTASLEQKIPPWLEGKGKGWVTAEYAMLPRSTHTRSQRKASGRSEEIQRLIGRALRAAVRMPQMGERQITVDCDVIQADGGTRTAAITGGWVALAIALKRLTKAENLKNDPLRRGVAAVSVGIVAGVPCLDLAYTEDSNADVDCNFVMTDAGQFIEIQGTAEKDPFTAEQYGQMVTLASQGITQLIALQQEALKAAKVL
jgi:ribonuclease PH